MRSDTDVRIEKKEKINIFDYFQSQSSSCSVLLKDHLLNTANRGGIFHYEYPQKPLRYFAYGYNYNAQDCYTPEESSLLGMIQQEHTLLLMPDSPPSPYFSLTSEEKYHGFWKCITPAYIPLVEKIRSASFTLDTVESKDLKTYPLWQLADGTARHIANWQSLRVKRQFFESMNDPAMFVFEELKDWFHKELTLSECNENSLNSIHARIKFIKNIAYLLPDFGNDKLYFHNLKQTLDKAVTITANCITGKSLPEKLTDVIKSSADVENIIGTYLHYLLINDPVSDNFSTHFINENNYNCIQSPVCKLFSIAFQKNRGDLSHFYSYNSIHQNTDLDVSLLDTLHFADFVSSIDKEKYLKSIAILDTLIKTRKLFEDFKGLQDKIGSFTFAINYISQLKELTDNYVRLMNTVKSNLLDLVQVADAGLGVLYRNPDTREQHHHFEKNMRTLETRISKSTTVKAQLTVFFSNSITAINNYQAALKQLVLDIETGAASKQVEESMKEAFSEISQLNHFIPALIEGKPFNINDLISNKVRQNHYLPAIVPSEIENQLTATCPPAILSPSYTGKWDDNVKFHSSTKQPIFMYRIYQDGIESGTAEFYGEPAFCVSEDRTQHNMLNPRGIFLNLQLPDMYDFPRVCSRLPPRLMGDMAASALSATINGTCRGVSNTIYRKLDAAGFRKKTAYFVSQAAFFTGVFSTRLYSHYNSQQQSHDPFHIYNAVYQSAIETGGLLLSNAVLGAVNYSLESFADFCARKHWSMLSVGINSIANISRYSLFAYQAANQGVGPAASAIITGTVSETIVNKAGEFLF